MTDFSVSARTGAAGGAATGTGVSPTIGGFEAGTSGAVTIAAGIGGGIRRGGGAGVKRNGDLGGGGGSTRRLLDDLPAADARGDRMLADLRGAALVLEADL